VKLLHEIRFTKALVLCSKAALLLPLLISSIASAQERIGYVTFRPGNWDIYQSASGQAQPTRLTDDPALDYDAVVSPDGRWLVFSSERDGTARLYVSDLSRPGKPRRLFASEAFEDQPAISANGKWIAFVSTRDGNADIFIAPFRPTQRQALRKAKNLTNDPGADLRPAFSPDCKSIAFCSDRATPVLRLPAFGFRKGDVYRMDLDGKNLRRLTNDRNWNGSPTWSADGRTIYYYSATVPDSQTLNKAPSSRIWRIDADGKDARPVTPPNEFALSPASMLNGRVAYASTTGDLTSTGPAGKPHFIIKSISPDGTDERKEVEVPNNSCMGPAINPRSGAIVFHGDGPEPAGVPPTTFFDHGSWLVGNRATRVALPDRRIDIYAFRGTSVAIRPLTNEVARMEQDSDSTTHLQISDVTGAHRRDVHVWRPDDPASAQIFTAIDWSNDGNWLCVTQGRTFGGPNTLADVVKVHPDGSDFQILSKGAVGNNGFGMFTGDGKRIVFRSGRTGHYNVFLMNADGSAARDLTPDTHRSNFPAISPRGDEIAFCSDRDGFPLMGVPQKTYQIYTMKINLNGTLEPPVQRTHGPAQNAHLHYSPDGRWLVFTSESGGINDEEPLIRSVIFAAQPYGEIFAMRLADGKVVRLTQNKWEDGTPTWVGPVR